METCVFCKIIKVELPSYTIYEDDVVKGLEIGANDYITKPFSTRELLVRINKILSKNNQPIKTIEQLIHIRAVVFIT